MRDRVAICFEVISRSRAGLAALAALASCLGACQERARDPVEFFSTSLALDAVRQTSLSKALHRGVYLVEVREQDIDVRVAVDSGDDATTLEDRLPRHGVVYRVVSLRMPATLRIVVSSADHRSKRGAVAVRILRFARDIDAPAEEIENGYVAQSAAAQLAGTGKQDAWPGAADKLHEAISHFETAGDEPAKALAAYSLCYLQYGPRDQFAAAVRACESAAEAFSAGDDVVGVHDAATLRAAAEIELASSMMADTQRAERSALLSEADRRLADAARFFESRGLGVRAEYAVNMRAVRAATVGDYEGAAGLLARAVVMARANEDVREQALTLANLAAIHSYLGQVAQAAQEYEALLPLIDRDAQPYNYAGLLGNYGQIAMVLGDFDRALALHTEALEIYARLGEEDERAVELSALGGLYLRMGDGARALDTLAAAITMQERVSDTVGLAGTLRLAGNAATALGNHTAALGYLERSARIDGNPHSVARTNVLIADELRSMGRLDAAEKALAGSLGSANRLVLANAVEERARIRLARRDATGAIADLRAADREYASLGLEINRIDTNTSLSRTLLSGGDVAGATAAADEAVAIVGRIRVKSANPEWRARFLSARYAPYEVRIAAELASTAPAAQWRAFRIAEEVRARSLADELAVGGDGTLRTPEPEEAALRARLTSLQLRLESDLQRQGADPATNQDLRGAIAETRAKIEALRARHGVIAGQSALSQTLARVQAALPQGTAVLAYFVGDSAGYSWLLTRDTLRFHAMPGREVLERAIVSAQSEERRGVADSPAGRELGRYLLGDLLDDVDAGRLLILADGPLNSVPFAALPVPRHAGELVIDRFVIGSAPSLALALDDPAHAQSRNTRVAVVSDPIYAADDRRLALAMRDAGTNLRGPPARSSNRFTRLPFSALEAGAVRKAFGAAETIQLEGFDATPERVFTLPSRELAVLHFATHAVAHSDSPEQSALFLTEYARDGRLLPASRITVNDIARTGLRADVVVLSGCATGDGRALRGEGVLGLTYGFLANGAHAVVASLWPIEDASTARFMNEFYGAYRASGRAADALRTAQLRTRGSTAVSVWSSFVVRANGFP